MKNLKDIRTVAHHWANRIGDSGKASSLSSAGFKPTNLTGPEIDAILAGLRLLAREVKAGNVRFSDDDLIGQIWTNAGDHDGLTPEEIDALRERLND